MIFWTLFLIGILTAALNGCNVVASEATWKDRLVWGVFAFGGVGIAVLAIFLRKWGMA